MPYIIASTATSAITFTEYLPTTNPHVVKAGRQITINGGAGVQPRVSSAGYNSAPKTHGHQADFVATVVSDEDYALLLTLPNFKETVEKGFFSVKQIKKEMRASAVDLIVEEEMLTSMRSWHENKDRQLTRDDFGGKRIKTGGA